MDTIVDLKHVHVARGNNVVLRDLSLRINGGEHLAILGPNGCGILLAGDLYAPRKAVKQIRTRRRLRDS